MTRITSLTEAQVQELNKKHPHEIFAVTLMLCTPSDLSRAWTNNDSLDPAAAELKKLPLSDDMHQHALKVMKDFVGVKSFFKGIADLQVGIYDGPEPHPRDDQPEKIIKALRALDP